MTSTLLSPAVTLTSPANSNPESKAIEKVTLSPALAVLGAFTTTAPSPALSRIVYSAGASDSVTNKDTSLPGWTNDPSNVLVSFSTKAIGTSISPAFTTGDSLVESVIAILTFIVSPFFAKVEDTAIVAPAICSTFTAYLIS